MTLLKFIFLGIKLHVSSGFQPKLLHTYTTQACAHKCNSAIFYVIYLFLRMSSKYWIHIFACVI